MRRPSDFDLSRPLDPGGPRMYWPPVEAMLADLAADLPPEPAIEAEAEWQDWAVDTYDPDDRHDGRPGLDPRCFGSDQQ